MGKVEATAPITEVFPGEKSTGAELETISTHYGSCAWTPKRGYTAWTKQGEVEMFENGGQRAVELMLMTTAACLNYFLAEHVKVHDLPVTSIRVACDGAIVPDPDRLGRITTRVTIEGTLSRDERKALLEACQNKWKVMNTITHGPVCETILVTPSGEVIDRAS
ncbi:OsmC family protein [Microbaculum sp. FT89]|uniref:OsmC family protein n=1 Tax=Microbaculum sp. FT89 TaxID=3447298 RepID=UPI003F53A6F1